MSTKPILCACACACARMCVCALVVHKRNVKKSVKVALGQYQVVLRGSEYDARTSTPLIRLSHGAWWPAGDLWIAWPPKEH